MLLVDGLLRVFYFEKGADYYFSSGTFIAKLSLVVIVGLLSIVPTIEFLSSHKSTAAGQVPTVAPAKLASLRCIIHIEMAGILLIVLCAALMARGIG